METALDYLTEEHDWQISSDPRTYDDYPNIIGLRNYTENGINYDADCGGYHRAHDLFNRQTDNVPAVTHGTVIRATKRGSFGGEVIIRDLNGYIWIYGHLQRDSIKLKAGDKVRQGDIIGLQGNSNYYDNPMSKHLHLQLLAPGSSTKLGTKWYCPGLQIDRYNINNGDYTPVKAKGNDNVSNYMNLPQMVDKRGKLTTSNKWRAPKRQTSLRNCERAIHHSLTKKNLAGSTPEAFANYHVKTLKWPCIGYPFTITPSRVVQTPNGPRAEISLNVSLDLVTYHVGNANDLAIGIVIAGDYRTDTLDDPTMASYYDLMEALNKDKIALGGVYPHSDYPGYAWKQCSVFDPVFAYNNGKKASGKNDAKKPPKNPTTPKPKEYTVQQGDTLYGIAHGENFTHEELAKWNNIKNPTELKIGQVLKLNGTAAKDNQENTELNWKWNNHNTEYAALKGEWTNGNAEITQRKGSPKLDAPIAGKLAPGKTIKIREIARSEGFIWVLEDGSDIWTPIKKYDRATGSVGNRWGSW